MTQAAVGWHGKLPSVSDFAARRLDPAFIELWDAALSASLAALRDGAGERWTDVYLASPTWRFVAGPGFLPPPFDATGWTGLVMPSVDRVGRYYPLTLALPLDLDTASTPAVWHWLGELEDAAYAARQEAWPIERREAELERPGGPPPAGTPPAPGEAAALQGCSRWCRQMESGPAAVLRASSLEEAFAALWSASEVPT